MIHTTYKYICVILYCQLEFSYIFIFLIGQLPADKIDFNLLETDVTEENFPHNPVDFPDFDGGAKDFWKLKENFANILDIISKIKDAGNTFKKAKDNKKAISKYK